MNNRHAAGKNHGKHNQSAAADHGGRDGCNHDTHFWNQPKQNQKATADCGHTTVRRIGLLDADAGVVGAYVHGTSRIAVLVELKGGDQDLAKDVAMHVAAINPQVVSAEDMPADVVAKEKEIYTAQAQDSGKPAEIIEKMIGGRLKKFLAENSLLAQAFVKDPDVTVGKLVSAAGAEVVSFVRFEVGEGIEVEEVDFAAEVAAQLNG